MQQRVTAVLAAKRWTNTILNHIIEGRLCYLGKTGVLKQKNQKKKKWYRSKICRLVKKKQKKINLANPPVSIIFHCFPVTQLLLTSWWLHYPSGPRLCQRHSFFTAVPLYYTNNWPCRNCLIEMAVLNYDGWTEFTWCDILLSVLPPKLITLRIPLACFKNCL